MGDALQAVFEDDQLLQASRTSQPLVICREDTGETIKEVILCANSLKQIAQIKQ